MDTTENQVVPIQVLNISPESITIYKDSRVVTAHSIGEDSILVAEVSNNNPTPQGDISDSKQQLLWQTAESARDELNLQEQEQLYAVLYDVFADNSGDIGKADEIQHTIDTKHTPPYRQPTRRIPVAQQEEV